MKLSNNSGGYIYRGLFFILLMVFIAFSTVGGCNDNNNGGSPGDTSDSVKAFMSVTLTCSNVAPGESCFFKPDNLCPDSQTITSGGCDCEYVNDNGASLGSAPNSLSIPSDCTGNLEFGATCTNWECNCFNDTDNAARIATTVYALCI